METKKDNKYNCEKCNFKCNTKVRWEAHIDTELHKTGQRKKRSDFKDPFKCEDCEYTCSSNSDLEKHIKHQHTRIKSFFV